MRVFIINANWGQGGPGGIAADLYNVLTDSGHKCMFAYGRGSIPQNVSAYRVGTNFDVYVHATSSRVFDNAGFMSGHATEKLISEIRSFGPDVVSLHNLLGNAFNVEKLFNYLKTSGIPTFWTLHDCWAVTGHCITGICDHWEKGCGACPNIREGPKSLVFDRSAKNYSKKKRLFSDISNLSLVSPSEWLYGIIKRSYLKHLPIQVINNGIDLSVFKPIESDLRSKYGLEDKKVLLSVANVWSKNKGGTYLNELAETLDDDCRIIMIGKDADLFAGKSERMLCFARTDDRRQLAQWYTTADIFVNPTMGDNFPTVNLEALACGTPVITFDTGGSGESVGHCGAVVAPGDVEALRHAIAEFDVRKISSDACVGWAKRFDKKSRYRDYLDLFETAVPK